MSKKEAKLNKKIASLLAMVEELQLEVARNKSPSSSTEPQVLVVQEPEQPNPAESTPKKPRRNAGTKGSTSTPSSANASGSQNSKEKPKPRKKETSKNGNLYRIKRVDYPEDGEKLKDTFILHIRLLGDLPNASDVPKEPEPATIEYFKSRFSTEANLSSTQHSDILLIPVSSVKVHSYSPTNTRKKILCQLGQIEEHLVEYVKAYLARYGLPIWGPNYNESPYSLYNSAMRIVAIDTFKQGLVSHGYSFTGVNTIFATNIPFLIKVYDHIVHSFFYDRYLKERRKPGTFATIKSSNPLYQARKRLAETRLTFLQMNGYPRRIQKLIHAKATSDDEAGEPVDKEETYYVKKRPERSQKMETFIRNLDKQIEAYYDTKGLASRIRNRVIPAPGAQKESSFRTLPTGMPIDYFDPAYFNKLAPVLRANLATSTVAFPPNIEDMFDDENLNMSDKLFQKKYGASILADYKFVNKSELRARANSESDSGSESESKSESESESDMSIYEEEEYGAGDEMESVLDEEEEAEFIAFKQSKLASTYMSIDS